MNDAAFQIMLNEYREACKDYYEARYGEKHNVTYTVNDKHDGKTYTGSSSGVCIDEVADGKMILLRRMMKQLYGEQMMETLKKIRKEERQEAKEFFAEHPEFICYRHDMDITA